MPKYSVLMFATVPVWKRATFEAPDQATAERNALDEASDDMLDGCGWNMCDEAYPENAKVEETTPVADVPCEECGTIMHQCATGEEGCLHCDKCQGSPDDLDAAEAAAERN